MIEHETENESVMKVRFEGGPHDGERDELEDGTLGRWHQVPKEQMPNQPGSDEFSWYAYVNTFTNDDDGTAVFRYTSDDQDPLFEAVLEVQEQRRQDMLAVEMERHEVVTLYHPDPRGGPSNDNGVT